MLERLHGLTLAAIISVALVLKVVILYLLHEAIFAPPPPTKTRTPPAKVAQRLPGAPAATMAFTVRNRGQTTWFFATLRSGKVV